MEYILELTKKLISLSILQANGFSYNYDGDRTFRWSKRVLNGDEIKQDCK